MVPRKEADHLPPRRVACASWRTDVYKRQVLNTYRNYMEDYSSLWDEFENDNPFKANYRVSIADLSQMESMSTVSYTHLRPITAYDPTLTFNTIGRHQSMLVRTRIASTGCRWMQCGCAPACSGGGRWC